MRPILDPLCKCNQCAPSRTCGLQAVLAQLIDNDVCLWAARVMSDGDDPCVPAKQVESPPVLIKTMLAHQ